MNYITDNLHSRLIIDLERGENFWKEQNEIPKIAKFGGEMLKTRGSCHRFWADNAISAPNINTYKICQLYKTIFSIS